MLLFTVALVAGCHASCKGKHDNGVWDLTITAAHEHICERIMMTKAMTSLFGHLSHDGFDVVSATRCRMPRRSGTNEKAFAGVLLEQLGK